MTRGRTAVALAHIAVVSFVCLAVIAARHEPAAGAAAPSGADLERDWAVAEGLTLEVDATGFSLPSAIRFVGSPDPGRGDPLYFVTELRGAVKVVTNDRAVHTFAEVEAPTPEEDLPAGTGQTGLAGLCLDDVTGRVFVTYTYLDRGNVLRNAIARFDTAPRTFGLRPQGQTHFLEPFDRFQSAAAHQIGGCIVEDGLVYVGVGDGGNSAAARQVDTLLGKVLCIDGDGRPCPDHPFGDGFDPASYVWAYGFRNPFGLHMLGEDLYAAENGVSIDRFHRLEKGADHHWNGSDASIATGADVVFDPGVSPVELEFAPAGAHPLGEAFDDHFVMAACCNHSSPESDQGVVTVGWGTSSGEPTSPPAWLLQYVGPEAGEINIFVTGVALGPDGLYVVPTLPAVGDDNPILKLRHDPPNGHPVIIGRVATGEPGLDVAVQAGCGSCHTIAGEGGGIGPELSQFSVKWRVTEQVNSNEFEEELAAADHQADGEATVSWEEARQAVLDAEGTDRAREYIINKILEPKFADPEAAMPDLGLDRRQAAQIADYLVAAPKEPGQFRRAWQLARQHPGYAALGWTSGVVTALVLIGVVTLGLRFLRRRRRIATIRSERSVGA